METFFITEMFKKNSLTKQTQAMRMNELYGCTECTSSILDSSFKHKTHNLD